MAWSVHLIDRTILEMTAGAITAGDLGPLTTATIDSYVFRRNDIGQATIEFHVTDPLAVSDFQIGNDSGHLFTREFAIYEDSTLRWWGRPHPAAVSLDGQTVTLRCVTFESYTAGKVFGRANRVNQLVNGGFEDGDLSDWTEVDPGGVATMTVDADAIEGNWSAEIVATANSAYLAQQLTSTVDHSYPPGLVLVATAWCKIDSGADLPEGTTLMELGTSGAVTGSPFTALYETSVTTPVGSWFKVRCEQLLAADVDWTVEVRLFGVDGTIRWDKAMAVYPDSTGAVAGDDVADLLFNILTYSQHTPSGQSDEQLDLALSDIGVTLTVARGFQHADHENIWQSLQDLLDEYGIDLWVGLDRTWHLAAKRGAARADLDVTVTLTDEVATTPQGIGDGARVDIDPSQQHSSIIVLGEGADYGREEAGAVDTSEFGGMVKTKVVRAPLSATPADLEELAEKLLAKEMRPAALPRLTYQIADLDDCPEPGDTIEVDIDFGCVQFNDSGAPITLRIEEVTVDPLSHAVSVALDRDWS